MFEWIYKIFRRKWAELSWGELFDKIAILRVKRERLGQQVIYGTDDFNEFQGIRGQYSYLNAKLRRYIFHNLTRKETNYAYDLLEALYQNNYTQWDYENAMSLTGGSVSVEDKLEAMKNSYTQNRKRAIIKRQIDKLLGSKWLEVKKYDGMKNES